MKRRDFFKTVGGALVACSGLAQRAAARPRNLLFIMTDQQRFDALSCAGNLVLSTPNLDRLAREGAMFRNAISACPVCVPARTSMLTGKSMGNTGVTGNLAAGDADLDPGPTFDNILHDRGYKSQYYGKWHSPYRMARTYDNKVAAVGVRMEGVVAEKQQYLAYLDQHVPVRPLLPGELIDPGSDRPYTPAILDMRYEQSRAQLGRPAQRDQGADLASEPPQRRARKRAGDDSVTQAEVYGFLHIPKEHSRAAHTVNQCLQALDQMKDGPFSLTCSIGPPHPPMLNVEPYWGMYPAGDMPLPKNFKHDMTWSPYRERAAAMTHYQVPENIRAMISIYYGMVKEIDDNIGRLLRRVDELGLAGNTLVLFVSDHGEMMGSHGMNSKMVFYEESVHVPLLMRLPGAIKAGTVVSNPVSHRDLFATILDYLGVPAPGRDGQSLRSLVEGRNNGYPDFVVSEWGPGAPNFMVRTGEWKLIMANRPEAKSIDALFNLKDDPYETRNVMGAPADRAQYRKQAGQMKERLVSWLESVHSPHLNGVKQRSL
jgi:arylsulfatase A-like enzyme